MKTAHNDKKTWKLSWIAALAAVVVIVAWMASGSASAQKDVAGKDGAGGTSVLARIGEVEILSSDVEATVATELGELDRQRHELMEKGLEAAINDALVEIAAEQKGMTSEDFLKAEVDAKVTAVTDADVDQFYEARKGQINQPKEAIVGQIRQYLEQTGRNEAFGALVAELRKEHKPQVLLEPMRVEVAEGGAPAKGPESAPVTIVEFSDFQCPFCSRVIPTLDKVTETYGDQVRLVFRQFPLHSIHPQAQKAAEAALCADDQGKFWEMHDALFQNQSKLQVADLKSRAAELELDAAAFEKCLDSGQHADRVTADLEAGMAAGVTGTPAMFINGRFLSGAQPFEAISKVIDDELSRAGG